MILLEHQEKFPDNVRGSLEELAKISKWLRTERELAFYGDIDFIPTDEYSEEDAIKAIDGAKKVVEAASKVIKLQN
jgi:HEPN domain-containing protein